MAATYVKVLVPDYPQMTSGISECDILTYLTIVQLKIVLKNLSFIAVRDHFNTLNRPGKLCATLIITLIEWQLVDGD